MFGSWHLKLSSCLYDFPWEDEKKHLCIPAKVPKDQRNVSAKPAWQTTFIRLLTSAWVIQRQLVWPRLSASAQLQLMESCTTEDSQPSVNLSPPLYSSTSFPMMTTVGAVRRQVWNQRWGSDDPPYLLKGCVSSLITIPVTCHIGYQLYWYQL